MRKALIGALKVLVPLALGVWLVVYSHGQLSERQRGELFTAFRQADWWWLALSTVLGWLSHLVRAWRWRYLLEHVGHRVSLWNAYNATMTGYFMNMLLPRAGEASRAVMLHRAEAVPFGKGFGTILAERAVDMLMLLGIAALTLALQLDKLDLFQAAYREYHHAKGTPEGASHGGPGLWTWLAIAAGAIALVAGAYLLITRPALRARAKDALRGIAEGLRSVLGTRRKGAFAFHTVLIWALYVAMFWIGFLALPGTAEVPFAGMMAGFIAGSVGIIIVQGGIGAYPLFVAFIVSVYMPAGGGLLRPDALAMGWLLWAVQTAMIIGLGGLSLLLISRERGDTRNGTETHSA